MARPSAGVAPRAVRLHRRGCDPGWRIAVRGYPSRKAEADRKALRYDYVAARITLRINSELSAVGLTAAVSRVLADARPSASLPRMPHRCVPPGPDGVIKYLTM
jgi:hypothetical protein